MNLIERIFVPSWLETYKWLIPVKLFFNEEIPLGWNKVTLKKVLKPIKDKEKVEPDRVYKLAGVKWYGEGLYHRETKKGSELSASWLYPLVEGAFIYNRLFAWKESFAVVAKEFSGFYVSNEFPQFIVDNEFVFTEYLKLYFIQPKVINVVNKASAGSAAVSRNRFKEEEFLEFEILLPPKELQLQIVEYYNLIVSEKETGSTKADEIIIEIEKTLFKFLDIELKDFKDQKLLLVDYKEAFKWGYQSILLKKALISHKHPLVTLYNNPSLYMIFTRGRSPKYQSNSSKFILNQKCIRWNHIDINFTKSVDPDWLNKIEDELLTKEGDILINSTGEGTIGRASFVENNIKSFFYDSHILLLRLDKTKVNPYFFTELFNSRFIQKQIEVNKSAQSTKQTELGIDNSLQLEFPLPPLDMQNEIENLIRKLRSEKEEIQKEFKKSRTEYLNSISKRMGLN